MKSSKMRKVLAPIIAVVIVIVFCELVSRIFHISERLFPAPSAVFSSLAENFGSVIAADLIISLQNIFLGYIIAVPIGFVIAALCSQVKLISRAVTPLLIILMITPMSTLVPIFKLNIGTGSSIKILVIVLQVVPVIALNSLDGFSNPPEQNVKVLKAMGCGRWSIFFRVVFPNAFPQVFTGMELGCILGTISSMSADMAVGQGGLGYRVSVYASFAATSSAFATILVAALVGLLFFEIIQTIQKFVMTWK